MIVVVRFAPPASNSRSIFEPRRPFEGHPRVVKLFRKGVEAWMRNWKYNPRWFGYLARGGPIALPRGAAEHEVLIGDHKFLEMIHNRTALYLTARPASPDVL